jgi:hypothetical protein
LFLNPCNLSYLKQLSEISPFKLILKVTL